MRLSILDQSPVSRGESPAQALQHTIKLAQETERLGFTRYWVAEHHSTSGLASTSPEVLIGQIAARTETIKVGSGGVLLPQYSPLHVAENFKMLEAFYPGRIDLGLGRSPGGNQTTRMALTDGQKKSLSSFPRQTADLQGFLHNSLPTDHPYKTVKAGPRIDTAPDMWILGLSERGAKNAANLGVGFTYGHFINPENGKAAIEAYRERFKPSAFQFEPKVNVCVFVVCADTEKQAEELAISQDAWLLNVGKGRDTKVPSIEEVKKRSFSIEDQETIAKNRKRAVIGNQEQVKRQLEKLAEEYQTDELMLITNIYDFQAKLHSYRLLAETFSLSD
ncbi:MsnO8 family LLM class oxidoreductase [Sediminibacillus dalangtanensis]|uniref:MsnO8 family LLM class oxidoreductase n=1 Tax=Sediminibacillus dalangtanensis TaxID=2729421 RepID=A0ABX7VVC5_9BACI|nr:LLM class flavin-dependent oxidoreductase [Sediminibacillus dalangtanensis]QTM99545.1 MsnO8 family LLM class oxidoreductase [Sediminibacillus dalangtanensis]